MTVLRHEDILARLRHEDRLRRLTLSPMLDLNKQVGPGASVDLRLGTDFLFPRRNLRASIDPGRDDVEQEVGDAQEHLVLPLGDSLWLHPQQLVLGHTLEFVGLPHDCAAYVLGRSSWGRIGLLVATAVTVQPGYRGSLTLELVNEGDTPIRLYPGLRVAQLVLHSMSDVTEFPYDSKFRGAIGPEQAKMGWDAEEVAQVRKLGQRLGTADAAVPGSEQQPETVVDRERE